MEHPPKQHYARNLVRYLPQARNSSSSPANKLIVASMASGKSFINIKKRTGPKTLF